MKPKKSKRRYCKCWCGALLAPEPGWPINPQLRNDMRFKCDHCDSTMVYSEDELELHNSVVADPKWRHQWENQFRRLGHHNIMLLGRFKPQGDYSRAIEKGVG